MLKKVLSAVLFLLAYFSFFCFGLFAFLFLSECVHNTHLIHDLSFLARGFQFGSPFIILIPLFFSIYTAWLTLILTRKNGWTVMQTMSKILPVFWAVLCLVLITFLLFMWQKDFSSLEQHYEQKEVVWPTSLNPYSVTLKHALLCWLIAFLSSLLWFRPQNKLLLLLFPISGLVSILNPDLYLINQEFLAEFFDCISSLGDFFPKPSLVITAYMIWFIIFLIIFLLARYLIKDKAITDRTVIFCAGIWLFILETVILLGTIMPFHVMMLILGRKEWSLAGFLIIAIVPAIFLILWGRSKKTTESASSTTVHKL